MLNNFRQFTAAIVMLGLIVAIPIACAHSSHHSHAKIDPKSRETPEGRKFAERRDVLNFINDMYVKHGLNSWELKKLFKTVSPNPKVLQTISKPFEDVSWPQYRERFVTDERAQAGFEFWKQNEKALRKAESDFGVPAEIIIAIIGVETYYGRNTGSYPVFQTLATLAFDYPQRAQFFRKELEQFVLLFTQQRQDPYFYIGSYAGAMGIPQFIPSSYREYAINFSGSGTCDLNNPTDAIGSVANYFKKHGWETDQPVVYPAVVGGSEYQRLASNNSKDPSPKLTLGEYAQFNIRPKDSEALKRDHKKPANFIILNKTSKDPELWLTLNNFYVITRYNHSVNYAMAVYQLSQKIRALCKRQG